MLSLRLADLALVGNRARAAQLRPVCRRSDQPPQMTLVGLELLRLQLGVDLGDELLVVLELIHHLVERDAAACLGRAELTARQKQQTESGLERCASR